MEILDLVVDCGPLGLEGGQGDWVGYQSFDILDQCKQLLTRGDRGECKLWVENDRISDTDFFCSWVVALVAAIVG